MFGIFRIVSDGFGAGKGNPRHPIRTTEGSNFLPRLALLLLPLRGAKVAFDSMHITTLTSTV